MHGKKVPLSVVAAAISACAIEPELLNSERIAERFGNCGIELLGSEPALRRSNLYSTNNGERTCRTYAVVRFDEESNAQIDAEHAQVLAGNSIGAIFKASGWSIHKETLHGGTATLDVPGTSVATLMRLEAGAEVAMHVYRLLLEKDGQAIVYGTIIELHHPEYLKERDLRRLYAFEDESALHPGQIEELRSLGLDAA